MERSRDGDEFEHIYFQRIGFGLWLLVCSIVGLNGIRCAVRLFCCKISFAVRLWLRD
jgi:hypothetical protein